MNINSHEFNDNLPFPTDKRILTRSMLSKNSGTDFISVSTHINDEQEFIVFSSDLEMFNLFLSSVSNKYDECENTTVSLKQWNRALSRWKNFCTAESFDAVYEELAGINYAAWSVRNEHVWRQLNVFGAKLWRERDSSAGMLTDLTFWTKRYTKKGDSIKIRGY